MSGPSTRAARLEDAGFSGRTGVWLAAVAALSFAAALVVMVYGPDPARRGSIDADTFSSSALGHRLLAEFLERLGLDVRIRDGESLAHEGPRVPIVVAEPDPGPDFAAHFERLRREAGRRGAPVVLVLPKWRAVAARRDEETWVGAVSLVPESTVNGVLAEAGGGRVIRGGPPPARSWSTSWGPALDVELIRPQLAAPWRDAEPVAWNERGALVLRVPARRGSGEGPLYVVTDPDLLNNHGLPRADNVLAVDGLFRDVLDAEGVTFDEVVHGFLRDRSFMAELLRFPLVVVVLHGLGVFALVLWAGSARFGKARGAPPRLAPGKRALIDNTARLLTYGGKVRAGALRYFDETLAAVANHYHLPRTSSRAELARKLSAISAQRGVPIDLARCYADIKAIEDGRRDAGARAVRSTSRLHRWREEMTDGS